MNITTMSGWFDILQDKNGSAYFTNTEKSLFFNRAQIEFVNELLPLSTTSDLNIELSQDTFTKIAPLVYELPSVNMNSSGVILKSSINTSLGNITAGSLLWRPISIGSEFNSTLVPVKYLRHNDRFQFDINYFKKPSITNPKVRETYNSFIFSPINELAEIYFTVLKYPVTVDIDTNISSDLPDHTHDRIVAISLEFAGVGSRDSILTELINLKQKNV